MSHTKVSFFFSYLFFMLLSSTVRAKFNCRDESGDAVDWYFLYKLPDEKGTDNNVNGTQYIFVTQKTFIQGWTISKYLVTDKESILAVTLNPLYAETTNESLWILYNDQSPLKTGKSKGGHTKGVVGADNSGGFWLVHSVPEFPPAPNVSAYAYPTNGFRNGQSIFCLSLSEDNIDNVGIQLQYNQINVYWKTISEQLAEKYPNLSDAANGKRIKRAPWNNAITLTSAAGNEFYSFAKSSAFKKDLYEDWVAPALEADLYVESWLNGRGALPSNCSKKYKVNNVDKVQLCQISQCTTFTSTKDHSKWAVSASKNNPWLCVGDINRARSQERRGGGTVCTKNPVIWQLYYKSVASIQPCQRSKGLFYSTPEVFIV